VKGRRLAGGDSEDIDRFESSRRFEFGFQHHGEVQPIGPIGPINRAVVDAVRCSPDRALKRPDLAIEAD
jgi:hypothetical protein